MRRARADSILRRTSLRSALCAALLLAAACSKPKPEPSPAAAQRAFDPAALDLDDPDLAAGRATWMATCSTCHLTGLTGAPVIGNRSDWAPRIAQGLDTLYEHALLGFIGPEYKEMPPKGGFAHLSDEQVKQAVRFVVFASQ